MKCTKLLALVLVLAFAATAAWAQGRIEISPWVGYRTTGSISGSQTTYTDFHIEDGLAYGLSLGYRLNPKMTIEVRWSRVGSSVTAHGLTFVKTKVADIDTDTYHANFLFFWRGEEYKVRPYFVMGLGAISANAKNVQVGEQIVNPSAEWRFSWNMGLGMQAQIREKIGLKLQAIWLPTYINSTSGWWVDWWGNAWIVPISNYMNQFEFSAALVFRF
jgi:opacity protein-like surface antigen